MSISGVAVININIFINIVMVLRTIMVIIIITITMMTLVHKGLRDVISDGRDTVECGAAGSPRRCRLNQNNQD